MEETAKRRFVLKHCIPFYCHMAGEKEQMSRPSNITKRTTCWSVRVSLRLQNNWFSNEFVPSPISMYEKFTPSFVQTRKHIGELSILLHNSLNSDARTRSSREPHRRHPQCSGSVHNVAVLWPTVLGMHTLIDKVKKSWNLIQKYETTMQVEMSSEQYKHILIKHRNGCEEVDKQNAWLR